MFFFPQNYGVLVAKEDLLKIVAAFDHDGDGTVNFEEFCGAIRGGMNVRRTNVVREAFNKLDRSGDGKVDVNDVRGVYDVSEHPKLLSGQETEDSLLRAFLADFEDTEHPDGIVTWGEFEAYYCGISATIDNDDYFDLMIHTTWKLDEPMPELSRSFSQTAATTHSATRLYETRRFENDATGTVKHLVSTSGVSEHQRPPPPAKRIVGYTGHVPGAQDSFGESFSRVEERAKLPEKMHKLPPPPFKDEQNAFVRKGNAANNHSFRLE